jgi:molybdate transport system ATP-binding protein
MNGLHARFRIERSDFTLDVDLDLPARGVSALFGHSGSGKTTCLRAIAGLERAPAGYVALGDEVWQDEARGLFVPPHRRALGLVFQEASLFPHLSVRQNLLYGCGGRPPAADGITFDEVSELLGLERLLQRAPQNLSGGERQRVAVGRALLSQPRLLLMDEPLSALDRETRNQILPFFERLHDRLAIPVLYVTHDIGEGERLADRLVLMRDGRVVTSGPLREMQSDPELPLVLRPDAAVSLDAVVEGHDAAYGLVRLGVEGGSFLAPGRPGLEVGLRVRLRVGAGDVSLATERPSGSTILNVLPARILSSRPTDGPVMIVVLGLGDGGQGARLLARVTRRSWDALGLRDGMDVHAQVKGVALTRN